MTKKHFIRLADYIRASKDDNDPFTARQIRYLAKFCHEQNPRFKEDLWIAYIAGYCGPNGGKRNG